MKFLGYTEEHRDHRPHKKSKHYTFHIGPEELVIMRDIFDHVSKGTPQTLFTQPFTSRLNAMRTELSKVIRLQNVKLPSRPKGWNPEDISEVF